MAKSEKLDLYRKHEDEYVRPRKPVLVKVGPARYLSIEGRGAPAGEAFEAAAGAMYGMAFTIKMTRKFAGKGDYKVCHLEGLWWAPGKAGDFMAVPKDQWRWKLLIRVPTFIRETDLTKARASLADKGKPPEFKKVTLENINEGLCVQVLHVGPYSDEAATVAAMAELAAAEGLKFHGRHHEIYLSDPRRVPPERLKTILRHPVKK